LFLAAIASVSLKIELDSEAGTSFSMRGCVILPSGSDFDAWMSLSISFESCHRFGPTCADKKSAHLLSMFPLRAWVSLRIHWVSCAGESDLNSSTFAIFVRRL